MLENTESEIKKRQSRQTGNIRYIRRRKEEKQNKNTTQYALDTTIRKQTQITQIRHAPSYKQLEVKMNQTS
jgi:hypothetical protein